MCTLICGVHVVLVNWPVYPMNGGATWRYDPRRDRVRDQVGLAVVLHRYSWEEHHNNVREKM